MLYKYSSFPFLSFPSITSSFSCLVLLCSTFSVFFFVSCVILCCGNYTLCQHWPPLVRWHDRWGPAPTPSLAILSQGVTQLFNQIYSSTLPKIHDVVHICCKSSERWHWNVGMYDLRQIYSVLCKCACWLLPFLGRLRRVYLIKWISNVCLYVCPSTKI